MEELFCIGCGAQIQTEDKEKAGYTVFVLSWSIWIIP